MKVICTTSHRQPLPKGGFKRYTAGEDYDTEKDDIDVNALANFKPADGKAIPKPAAEKPGDSGPDIDKMDNQELAAELIKRFKFNPPDIWTKAELLKELRKRIKSEVDKK